MTQKKVIAKSIKSILDHPLIQNITDRSIDVKKDIIQEVLWFWSYDLFTRKPGPAYTEEGIFKGTDLDLACFLYQLIGRGAVIIIPKYESLRQRTFNSKEQTISNGNHNGQILGLTPNKNNFTFSIRIHDLNVIKEDSVGESRNFALTDFKGNWYKGWESINFVPTLNENKFITENKLWSDNKIVFKNFVHPNRWTSFFGQYYLITKILIDRLTDESKYYFKITKEMLESGIKFPPSDKEKTTVTTDDKIDGGKTIKVDSFEVEIKIPESDSSYPKYEFNQKNLVELSRLRNHYIYNVIPKLRFMTRVTELAHYNNPTRFPSWLKNVQWEKDYVIKGKRKKWERLVLFQPEVGKPAVSILKRKFIKSEKVSEFYKE